MKQPKVAIITQSYIGDLKECELLCESIDRFVSNDILHYIFVNDEDYDIFKASKINLFKHIIKKKSEILPKWLVYFPLKLLGHYYHVSPITIPVREWIIQQICKLGVFDAIEKDIAAVINIDSETIFMRKFSLSDIYDSFSDKYILFREPFREEPWHERYCIVAKRLLDLNEDIITLAQNCYMSHPVVFVKTNLQCLNFQIAKKALFRDWKMKLCNTYRFSEYYLYGLFVDYKLHGRNHYIIDKHLFPMVDIASLTTAESLRIEILKRMCDKSILGVWLQKTKRNESHYLDFDKIQNVVYSLWDKKN